MRKVPQKRNDIFNYKVDWNIVEKVAVVKFIAQYPKRENTSLVEAKECRIDRGRRRSIY